MKKKKKTMAEKMQEAEMIIQNLKQHPFNDALKPYGFDETRINEGQALYDEVKGLIEAKEQAYEDQFKATGKLQDQIKIVSNYFTKHAGMARRVLGNDKKLIRIMGISGRRKKALAAWTGDARTFYNFAMADHGFMAKMKRFGVTYEALEKGLSLIEDLLSLYSEQINKIGLAQVATPKKNKKMKELFNWISDAIFCTKLAFANDPQQLEQLITHQTSRLLEPLLKNEAPNPKSEIRNKFEIPMTETKKETSRLLETLLKNEIRNPKPEIRNKFEGKKGVRLENDILSVFIRVHQWRKLFLGRLKKPSQAA
jgi:hypothetical protein